jgi:hypothetical protein
LTTRGTLCDGPVADSPPVASRLLPRWTSPEEAAMHRITTLLTLALLLPPLGCGGDDSGGDTVGDGTDTADDDTVGDDGPDDGHEAAWCASDAQCQDGLFCNGEERCTPDSSTTPDGCRPAAAGPCLPSQTCDEATDSCLSGCAADPDADDDGHDAADCGGDDCDDTDDTVHPGAVELPGDEVDQDCDGAETCYADLDADGYRTEETVASVDATCDGEGEAPAGRPAGDCDDAEPLVHPGADELAGDGIDNDCDGGQRCFVDADADGHRTIDETLTVDATTADCSGAGEADAATPPDDCDDTDEAVHPEAVETAADGLDQDCDGHELCLVDADGDGYRPDDPALVTASEDLDCEDAGEAGPTLPAGDCDDLDPTVHPGAAEGAGDERDQDCDGRESCFPDADDDGYRPPRGRLVTSSDTDCGDAGEATASTPALDCNDLRATIHPYAVEACNAVDDDCDTLTDMTFEPPSLLRMLRQPCGTDEGACVAGRQTCADGAWGACTGSVGPSTETCDGAIDQDCDGATDEGCGCTAGTTRACGPTTDVGACQFGTQTCSLAGTWSACVGAVLPSAEVCDIPVGGGIDEDCDGTVNEIDAVGCVNTYGDADGDTYPATTGETTCRCFPYFPPPDCDDGEPHVHPGAPEACNTIDDDCDTTTDEAEAAGCRVRYKDQDRDGYGDEATGRCLCWPDPVFTLERGGDCCDIDVRAHPDVTTYFHVPHACGGFDYNCNGVTSRYSTATARCDSFVSCGVELGWIGGSVPACGVLAPWMDACSAVPLPPFPCDISGYHYEFQRCR